MTNELRFGYTTDDLDRFARQAKFSTYKRGMVGDPDDLVDLAYGAIAEYLYTADKRPTELQLVEAGWKAIWNDRKSHLKAHGQSDHRGRSGVRFVSYWLDQSDQAPISEPDDLEAVTDRLALEEALAQLTDKLRTTLLDYAELGTAAAVAQHSGLTEAAVHFRLGRAKTAIRKAWLAGETVPRRQLQSVAAHNRSNRRRAAALRLLPIEGTAA